MPTGNEQVVDTADTEKNAGANVDTQTTEKNEGTSSAENKLAEPYKSFSTKEEFDKHSAGILNSAKNKAEKELLAMLGLKPDEKDKLAKFKEAYDSTLSESEKQAKNLEALNARVGELEKAVSEKDAVISAISKITGKGEDDVNTYVKMAKGLVDENTTIEQALEKVFAMAKVSQTVPRGTPPAETKGEPPAKNPFETGNLTEQGKMIKTDREKAREMYFAVHGKAPNW